MPQNVLILGAGASLHYGFPLASGLVDKAIAWRGYGDRLLKCGLALHMLEQFSDQLARSGCTSVDQYVTAISNKDLRKVGKELMAFLLSQDEVQIPQRAPERWYERVANILIDDADLARFPM